MCCSFDITRLPSTCEAIPAALGTADLMCCWELKVEHGCRCAAGGYCGVPEFRACSNATIENSHQSCTVKAIINCTISYEIYVQLY